MDVVLLFNGLGNQMSQYAFYMAKKKNDPNCHIMFDWRSKHEHNGFELQNIFNVHYENRLTESILQYCYKFTTTKNIPLLPNIFRLLGFRVIEDPINYDYKPELLKKSHLRVAYYHGGWHSEKNFKSVETKVRKLYEFPLIPSDTECKVLEQTILSDDNSVSLHIRRGDYLSIPASSIRQPGGIATIEYYKKAIEYMLSIKPQSTFYVFSNEIEWCKKVFDGLKMVFIDCNRKNYSWRDMYLMSICRHHIIANSTFSWWGAWLCKHKGSITICPERFIQKYETKDIYPENWIKIKL